MLGSDIYNYLHFSYLACDLKQLSAADYQNSDNIVARINLPNVRHSRQDRLQQFLSAQLGLIRNETDPNKIRKYSDFIDYYADLTEQELIEYQEHYQTKEADIMGMGNIWKKQGLEQGEQIGKKKECISLLTRQLRRKFGLQPELEAALQQMSEMELGRLEDLADALLDFKAISDLLDWLNTENPHKTF